MSHWLLHYHPDFEENFERWLYAYDHLRARVYEDEGDTSVIDDFLAPEGFSHDLVTRHELQSVDRNYLIQKAQGEVDPAYDERVKITSYTPYYPFAVASLVGMFFDAQDEVTPTWQPEDAENGLGQSEDEDTVAHALENDFDGKGNGFASVLWQSAMDMVAMGEVWPVVEGVEREDGEKVGEAAVRPHPPLNVENWLEDENRLVETKLRIMVDERESLEDMESSAEAVKHVVYDTEGWRRFGLESSDSGISERVEEESSYEFWRTSDRVDSILPIYRADLPLRGNPGYNAARSANEIYNLESGLSFELWYSSFAKLFADVVDEDDGKVNEEAWDDLKDAIRDGNTVLPGSGHQYKAPPAQNAEMKLQWLKYRVKQFFRTFFQQFGDQAKERTATEIRAQSRSGVQAFLILLAHALEDMVNEALWRLEQVYFPEQPDLWGQASWTASKDFDPIDLDEQIDRMIKQVFPQGRFPLTETTVRQIVKRYHQVNDLEVPEEDELAEAASKLVDRETQAQSVEQDFGL